VGTLNETIRTYAQSTNFAALTVHTASGAMMTHVMWVDADDDHILLNTEVHRAKWSAIARDPRVTVIVWVKDDPYRFAEVRGRVVDSEIGPAAEAHINALARKYTGADHVPVVATRGVAQRVILRIAPEVQRVYDLSGPHT
jgi:PPOX class probable F420-dependent enzyme